MVRLLATALIAGGLAGPAMALDVPARKPVAQQASAAALEATTAAAEIIEKNAAARGGLEAWRKVQTMVWRGHVAPANGARPQALPFVLELQRPNKTRFEITAASSGFTRIFDGNHGWKLRPSRGGTPETKAFSPEEVSYAREEFVIDGPLMDYRAKGVSVHLEGTDELEGRKAYRLTLKLPSGAARRLWIDAQTFLDVRYDRPGNNPMAPGAAVSVFYRDYADVDGLKVPMRIETGFAKGLDAAESTDKLLLDEVLINPPLQARAFAKPPTQRQGRAIVNIGGGAVLEPGRPSP